MNESVDICRGAETPKVEEEKENNQLSRSICDSFASVFSRNYNINQLFFSLVKKLNKFFSINRSVLVVYSARDDSLKVLAMKRDRGTCEGLAVTLPDKDSLLYRIFHERMIYTENYPSSFEGNFVERRLLIDDCTKSLLVWPIRSDGFCNGLICLSSPVIYAFELIAEGCLEYVVDRFGKEVENCLTAVNV